MKNILCITILALVTGACKENRCSNGEQNKKEEGVDCGGPCEPCATCSDGIKNQDEVEIDCGGACSVCPVAYPESGTYGTNILNNDSLNFIADEDYSLRAEIPEGSSLKVIIYSVSGGPWFWSGGTNINCLIGPYDGTQSFEAVEPGLMQVSISFSGYGTALIQYFENSTSETKTKTISWE